MSADPVSKRVAFFHRASCCRSWLRASRRRCSSRRLLYGHARRATGIAWERQSQLVSHVLHEQVAKIPHDQQSVTIWDDAVKNTKDALRSASGWSVNLGIWMHDYFGHDEIFVLNESDRPIYANVDGADRDASTYRVRTPECRVRWSPSLRMLLLHREGRRRGRGPRHIQRHRPGHDRRPAGNRERAADRLRHRRDRTAARQRVSACQHPLPRRAPSCRRLIAGLSSRRRPFRLERLTRPATRRAFPLRRSAGKPARLLRLDSRSAPAGTSCSAHSAGARRRSAHRRRDRRSPDAPPAPGLARSLQASEAQAQHLAFHDALTGLPTARSSTTASTAR